MPEPEAAAFTRELPGDHRIGLDEPNDACESGQAVRFGVDEPLLVRRVVEEQEQPFECLGFGLQRTYLLGGVAVQTEVLDSEFLPHQGSCLHTTNLDSRSRDV